MARPDNLGHLDEARRQERVRERVEGLLLERLHVEIQDPNEDLFDVGVIDSLALVELLLAFESEFGVLTTADDLDIESFRSVGRMTAYVMERTADGGTVAR
jgi:acyl carrier protein